MSRETKSKFRERLVAIQGDLSNVEFARKCGLNTQDIQRYSKGLASPTIEKLVLISSAFSVSVDWLLGLSNTKTCTTSSDRTKEKIIALKNAATLVCANADSLLKSITDLENMAK